MKVSLHAHERENSGDSNASLNRMLREYNREGYGLVGIVGHDQRAHGPRSHRGMQVIYGIERELRGPPRRLHVIDFPKAAFRILAHPSSAFPTRTRERAARFARENNIDAIEKYNAGFQQYEGTARGVLEVAGDDAHNPQGIGTSLMYVDRPLMAHVRDGSVALANNPNPRGYAGKLRKYLEIAMNGGSFRRA